MILAIKSFVQTPRFFRLAKESSWIICGQIISILGSLILVRVLTTYLEPAQYGQLALGLTVAGFINQLVTGGIIGGIGRFYSIAVEKQDQGSYLKASQRLLFWTTAVVIILGLLLTASLMIMGDFRWAGLVVAIVFFSIFSSYNSALTNIQNAARQRAIGVLHGALDACLKIIIIISLFYFFNITSILVIVGYFLSSMIVCASQFFFLRNTLLSHRAKVIDYRPWMSQIWAYSWPFSTWGIFTWLQQASDKWALEWFTTTDTVGSYAVLYQLGFVPVSLGSSLLLGLLGPIIYQRIGEAQDRARVSDVFKITKNLSLLILFCAFLIFVFTCYFHSFVFKILVDKRYGVNSYLLPWLVIASGFQSCHHIIGVRISALLKTKMIIIPQIFSAFLFCSLNLAGSYCFGLKGLIFSFVISSFILYIWILLLSEYINYRHIRMTENTRNI